MDVEIIKYNSQDIYPLKADVLSSVGISKEVEIPEEIEDLYSKSFEIFKKLIEPKGIFKTITREDLDRIYKGENQNTIPAPLTLICTKADSLALYAFTLGKNIGNKVNLLITEKDYPLGYMLDRIASESTDKASAVAEKHFSRLIQSPEIKTLLYSPGYCGWHISSQKKIFEYLSPEQIGITLNESYLMTPIKSVSGVLVAGEKNIHVFKNNFSFCKDCQTYTCRGRMQS
ncbi:hypothetical protein N9934_00450 [Desulfosarcina sp.]|nr:hypothetical protein [Desulfosarcina sp.]